MATILEGPLPELMACAQAMHEAVLRGGCQRVVTHIAIDHRTDRGDGRREVTEGGLRRLGQVRG